MLNAHNAINPQKLTNTFVKIVPRKTRASCSLYNTLKISRAPEKQEA